jgi:hypothetical protein
MPRERVRWRPRSLSEWTAICLLCAETYIERRFCPLERAGVFFGTCPKCCAAVASFRFLCDKPEPGCGCHGDVICPAHEPVGPA